MVIWKITFMTATTLCFRKRVTLAQCTPIQNLPLRYSGWLPGRKYAIARVVWVVARALLGGPSQNNPLSFYGILASSSVQVCEFLLTRFYHAQNPLKSSTTNTTF